jgi:pSer/pThr/pTyr-binding forkhead associated (FHA) protein
LGGSLGVRDLDSTNGTIVVHPDETEERVSSLAETALAPGDRLEIGSYALEVQLRS